MVPGLLEHERLGIEFCFFPFLLFRQDSFLGWFQHTVQSPQHGKGKDDLTVFGLFVVTTQQVCDGPDKAGEILLVHGLPVPTEGVGERVDE